MHRATGTNLRMMMRAGSLCVVAFILTATRAGAQGGTTNALSSKPTIAIIGADVSFLRQMEQRGVVFKDAGKPEPGLQILKDHGYNWVRLRLFVDPKTLPNDLPYTLASAREAKERGFHFLLDLHYADDWADPAHQPTPKAWQNMPHKELVDAVRAYTRDTVRTFRDGGVMPDMIQIGNEVTSGFLWPDGRLPDHWDHFAELVAAGIAGVDEGRGNAARPRIMIHIDKGGNSEATKWFFDNLNQRGVQYDVIGQSYYPWWQGSLEDLRDNLRFMAQTYRKDIVVVETAYDWRTGEEWKNHPRAFPETPAGQRDFLDSLKTLLEQNPGGRCLGLFWWEPMAAGGIAKRALFDDGGNALPAIKVFDTGGLEH